MIVKRGERMGLDFAGEIEALRAVDWDRELAAVEDRSVEYPTYYKVPLVAPHAKAALQEGRET